MNGNLNGFSVSRRRAVRLSAESVVKSGRLDQHPTLPLVLEPNHEKVDVADWARCKNGFIEEQLLEHGAILFRGFDLDAVEKFDRLVRAVSNEMLEYREPSSPRTEVSKRIYTSTNYPSTQWIQMHNEMSYAHHWPRKVFFFCAQPAQAGGATPIASGLEVTGILDSAIKNRFREKKVMYVRSFSDELDIPWQQVFQTTDRAEVEQYCASANIMCEWGPENHLRTLQVRQSFIPHPVTGQELWFNQVHAFHPATLDPTVRQAMASAMPERDFPRHAFYGDGSVIEDSIIDEIRRTYTETAVTFEWRKGDVLLLDNRLTAHGREPFSGPRKILVAMSEMLDGRSLQREAVDRDGDRY